MMPRLQVVHYDDCLATKQRCLALTTANLAPNSSQTCTAQRRRMIETLHSSSAPGQAQLYSLPSISTGLLPPAPLNLSGMLPDSSACSSGQLDQQAQMNPAEALQTSPTFTSWRLLDGLSLESPRHASGSQASTPQGSTRSRLPEAAVAAHMQQAQQRPANSNPDERVNTDVLLKAINFIQGQVSTRPHSKHHPPQAQNTLYHFAVDALNDLPDDENPLLQGSTHPLLGLFGEFDQEAVEDTSSNGTLPGGLLAEHVASQQPVHNGMISAFFPEASQVARPSLSMPISPFAGAAKIPLRAVDEPCLSPSHKRSAACLRESSEPDTPPTKSSRLDEIFPPPDFAIPVAVMPSIPKRATAQPAAPPVVTLRTSQRAVKPTQHSMQEESDNELETATSDPSPSRRVKRRSGRPTTLRNALSTSSSCSSAYRGVSKHRLTQRWEASLWLQGRQLYLGGFVSEEDAAHAYDIAALACKGREVPTNFDISYYAEELKQVEGCSKEEMVAYVRRRSSAFSRGRSKYRGVSGHAGRWEARIGQFGGRKNVSFGIHLTEEAAARQYDRALIIEKGRSAKTNFPMAAYEAEVLEYEVYLLAACGTVDGPASAAVAETYTLPVHSEVDAAEELAKANAEKSKGGRPRSHNASIIYAAALRKALQGRLS
ncbi:hypothetical protein WJX72_008929 [[Myrmecia] bisecta]|uniref:AP2/ERF domain-containing protein n=1 Tax=[Myrmecia] bisecta TaxID=41462 RepID=A0AAW1QS03_9CHLO